MSTREDVRRKVIELFTENQKMMEKALDRFLSSGAVDIEAEEYKDADYLLPKILLTAVLRDAASQWEPPYPEMQPHFFEGVENLSHF